MTLAILILSLLTAGMATAALLAVRALRRELADAREAAAALSTGPSIVGRTVVLNTRDGTAVRGVVHGQYADRWSLREVTIMVVGSDAETPAGGMVHVPVGQVDLVNEFPA